MRNLGIALLAASLIALPAAAQQTEPAATGTTAVNAVGANTTDPALAGNTASTSAGANPQMNGLAGNTAAPAVPPTLAEPGTTDATVTPETGERRGFPWGVLGLLGLLGLLGRKRATRNGDANRR